MSPHTVRVLPTLPGVPVLLYHGIRHDGAALTGRDKKYWVSIGRFQAHLSAIKDAGFDVVLLRHLQMISGAWTRPQVVLTFDDGHSSDYHSAFPALLAASMRGEFFVNTAAFYCIEIYGFLGRHSSADGDEIFEDPAGYLGNHHSILVNYQGPRRTVSGKPPDKQQNGGDHSNDRAELPDRKPRLLNFSVHSFA